MRRNKLKSELKLARLARQIVIIEFAKKFIELIIAIIN